jgi:ribose 5-phosphate isomerase B
MSRNQRRVALGSDMQHPVAQAVAERLESEGYTVVRCGAVSTPEAPWPEVAEQVGRLVATAAVDDGVVCCWSGTGVSIAANKVPGIRAALCGDAETARLARRWNDANVLALSLRATSEALATEIVDAWMQSRDSERSGEADIERVTDMERRYRERAVEQTRAVQPPPYGGMDPPPYGGS